MISALRIVLRSLAKSPGFTVVAVLMLALGIGLSASSFSMANTFLLRNVPYPQPDRLVRLFTKSPQSPRGAFSPGNALALRQSLTSFSQIALYSGSQAALGEPGQPAERVQSLSVTANFFDLIGVQPVLGRGFAPGEDQPGKGAVAILSHRTWIRHYGADPTVLGRTVRINTESFTIIGVLPPAFDAPLVWGPVDFITPEVIYPDFHTSFKDAWIQVVARLKPRVSLRRAQSELTVSGARVVQDHPKENAGLGFRVVSLHDSNMDNVSRVLLWLMTAISLTMLLIACANLASLQVARAFGRSREFAIRAALGAGNRQLMLPLLAESFVLAIIGGLGGLFVASWSNDIIGHFLRINQEQGYAISFDGRVLAFAAFASILSGLAFGLAPAWLASRAPAAEALKEGSRGTTGSRSHQRLKNILIVAEVGLALALVGVATSFGIGARSFLRREVGWNPDGLFAGYLSLPWNRYHDDAVNRTFQKALLDKLAAIPGVEHAVICGDLPLFYLGGGTLPITVEGRPPVERGQEPLSQTVSVSPDYFAATGINLKAGAFFSPSVTEKDPPVAVVNESFAKRFWPDGSALGRRIKIGDKEQWIQIIGIVGDVKLLGRLETPETPLQLYRPYLQSPNLYIALVLRSAVAPDSLTQSVRRAVASLDPDLPLAQAGDVRTSMDRNLSNINLVIVNLGISAVMGLMIAGIGLFGVISQLMLQRTRDIGVRMALGAMPGDILQMILGQGTRLLMFGALLGVPLYFALNLLLRRAMPEMPLPGLWLLALNLVALATTMLLASYLPARRATRINPIDALRSE
ncbi:MAG TPA: ABC transporter permease [Opitutus sp.]|nr:ABC transporter permease [Opitutus sp.]